MAVVAVPCAGSESETTCPSVASNLGGLVAIVSVCSLARPSSHWQVFMSAIASFWLLQKNAIGGLRAAAEQGDAYADAYHHYLHQHGREVASYRWSGYFIGTLLSYLPNKCGIKLRSSDPDLSMALTEATGVTHIIFNNNHKMSYLDKLCPEQFSGRALHDFFNEFNAAREVDVSGPMLDGIRAIREALAAIDEETIVVVIIG